MSTTTTTTTSTTTAGTSSTASGTGGTSTTASGGATGTGGTGATTGTGTASSTTMAKPLNVAVTPKSFGGEANENSREFMDSFKRAGTCNNWTPAIASDQFPSYLRGTAAKWYKTWIATLKRAAGATGYTPPSWQDVQDQFAIAFSDGGMVVNAELKLDARKQQIDDTPESYVFEVLELCDAVDPNMTDARRVRFLLRGLREWYLNKIMPHDPTTPQQILTRLRNLYEMKRLNNDNVDRDLPVYQLAPDNPLVIEVKEMLKKTQELVEQMQEDRKQRKQEKEGEASRQRREVRTNTAQCYVCQRVGHLARDCNTRPAATNWRSRPTGDYTSTNGYRNMMPGRNRPPNYNEPRTWQQSENFSAGTGGRIPAQQTGRPL